MGPKSSENSGSSLLGAADEVTDSLRTRNHGLAIFRRMDWFSGPVIVKL